MFAFAGGYGEGDGGKGLPDVGVDGYGEPLLLSCWMGDGVASCSKETLAG